MIFKHIVSTKLVQLAAEALAAHRRSVQSSFPQTAMTFLRSVATAAHTARRR